MASTAAAHRGLLGRSVAAAPLLHNQHKLSSTASSPASASAGPGAQPPLPPPGRRAVAAQAATQMRPLPNLVGGLKSLRDISIDISEEDMSAIELRNVNVRLG